MSAAGLDCRPEELGDDHDQDLGEGKVDDAEFLAQNFALRLNRIGRRVGGCLGQGVVERARSQKSKVRSQNLEVKT